MRPSLSEQLRGLHGILSRVVAPEVADDYARGALDAVVRALRMLEDRAVTVVGFLEWDNHATAALLRSVAERTALPGPVDATAALGTGADGLEAENERLRGLLAAVVPTLAADPAHADLHAAVVAHLRDRIDRYPFSATGALPSR